MSSINGKAPVNGAGAPPLDAPLIKVQPPRREDLQPSYAQVIKPDDADADTNGWYGSMVSSSTSLPQSPTNHPPDQYSR
jgi:erythrocyte band 7 integral membrane protein